MEHPFVTYLVERDLIPSDTIKHLSKSTCMVREPIGMIAVGHGLLIGSQIDHVLDEQRGCTQRGDTERFGEIAIRMGYLTEEHVQTLVRIQEFRTAVAIMEALTLAKVFRYEDAIRYLGCYFTHDDEILDVITNQ